jgi:hypothetical protein
MNFWICTQKCGLQTMVILRGISVALLELYGFSIQDVASYHMCACAGFWVSAGFPEANFVMILFGCVNLQLYLLRLEWSLTCYPLTCYPRWIGEVVNGLSEIHNNCVTTLNCLHFRIGLNMSSCLSYIHWHCYLTDLSYFYSWACWMENGCVKYVHFSGLYYHSNCFRNSSCCYYFSAPSSFCTSNLVDPFLFLLLLRSFN